MRNYIFEQHINTHNRLIKMDDIEEVIQFDETLEIVENFIKDKGLPRDHIINNIVSRVYMVCAQGMQVKPENLLYDKRKVMSCLNSLEFRMGA